MIRWNAPVRYLAALVVALGLTGLSEGAEEHTQDGLPRVKKALADKSAVLIDVREKTEWDAGHLQQAKLLSLSVLQNNPPPKVLEETLPKDKPIYLHCAAGRRCLKAAEILRKHGYDVRPLKQGYGELLKEGFPKADN